MAIRIFNGLAAASFVVTGILLVVAPDAARFGAVYFGLIGAGFGLTPPQTRGTVVGGSAPGVQKPSAQAVARCVGEVRI